MMMNSDSKKIAGLIISKSAPSSEKKVGPVSSIAEKALGKDDAEEDDSDPGMMAAAEDVLSAVETKDASQLKAALMDFFTLCQAVGGEGEGSSEEAY